MTSFISATFDRDTLLRTFLGFSAEYLSSAAVLILGLESVKVGVVRAWDVFETAGPEALRSTSAALSDETPLKLNETAYGSSSELSLDGLFTAFGGSIEEELVAIPVVIGGTNALALLGIPRDPENFDPTALELVSEVVGEQIETIIKRAKAGTLPQRDAWVPEVPEKYRLAEKDEAASEDEAEGAAFDLFDDEEDEADPAPGAVAAESDPASSGAPEPEVSEPEVDVAAADDESDEAREVPASAEAAASDESEELHTIVRMPFAEAKDDGRDGTQEIFRPSEEEIHQSVAEDDDDESPEAMMGPRLGSVIDDDDDDEPAPPSMSANPNTANATMFGVALVAPKEDREEPEEEVVQANASSTMFGLPVVKADGTPNLAGLASSVRKEVQGLERDASEADQVSEASEPEHDEPSVAPEHSDVVVVSPRDIGDEASETSRTLMGGLQAQVDLVRQEFEISEQDRSPGQDATKGSTDTIRMMPGSTLQGGIEVEKLGIQNEEIAPEPEPDVSAAPPKRGLPPGMMIFKRGKKKRRKTPNPETTLSGFGEGSSAQEVVEPEPEPPKSDVPEELGDEASSSTIAGMKDDWQSADEKRAGASEEVNDAWLDYFGADEEDESFFPTDEPNVHAGSESSEPHSLPPETLERLLESGPDALDLQEHYLELDSRNKAVAFAAAEEVARSGSRAYEPLSAMFPGRVFIDRYQYTPDTMPSVEEHGPIFAALVRLGDAGAASAVAPYLNHKSNETRFYAVFCFTELPALRHLEALVERLFDKDAQIRALARQIIIAYQDEAVFEDVVLRQLREEVELAQEDLRVEIAAKLLAQFRDAGAVPALIDSLGRYSEHTNRVIFRALRFITLKGWSSPYEWKQWWEGAREEPRSKWIVSALDSDAEDLRILAFDEIQRIPGLEISYHPEQPSKLRQRAQKILEKFYEEQSE